MNKQKTTKTPEISVIMSVYNSQDFLDEAITSILSQTFKNFELIIVNDCSTDNSLNIIKKYKNKDPRILVINNKENLGRAKARNKALKIAKGKYIAILDSDDIALPNRLEEQYKYMEKNQEIFLVGSSVIKIKEDGTLINISKVPFSTNKVAKKLPKRNCIKHPSVMYRNTGRYFYREKFPYAQDYDLYLRLLSDRKKMANLKTPLTKYRLNTEGVSWAKAYQQRLFAEKASEFYFNRINDLGEGYENFNPETILQIETLDGKQKLALEQEIAAKFKLYKFQEVRKLSRLYFADNGFFNRVSAYYMLSFLGVKVVNFLRRIFSL